MVKGKVEIVRQALEQGRICRAKGDHVRSLQYFRDAEYHAVVPYQLRESQLCSCEALRELGQLDAASSLISKICEKWPHHDRTRVVYGTILQEQGDLLAAIENYYVAFEAHSFPRYMLDRLFKCATQLGQSQLEIVALEKAWSIFKHIYSEQDERQRFLQLSLQLGDRYRIDQSNSAQSQVYYRCVLELEPQHLWANLKLAIALRDSGEWDDAEVTLKSLLHQYPKQYDVLMHLGEVERCRQNFEAAIAYFEKAQNIRPQRLEARIKSIDLQRQKGDLASVAQQVAVLEQQYPKSAVVVMQRGRIFRQQGQGQRALKQFRVAEQWATEAVQEWRCSNPLASRASTQVPPYLLHPHREAKWAMIEELRELGRLDEAQHLLEASAPEFQAQVRTQMLLGSLLQRRCEFDAAVTVYQQLLQTLPQCVPARIELARTLSQSHRLLEAIALLEETPMSLLPHAGVLLLLGQLYLALEPLEKVETLDKNEQARDCYERVIQSFPQNPQGYCGLAEVLVRQGDVHQAYTQLLAAQEKCSHSLTILQKFANLAMHWGNCDDSLMTFNNARQRFPNDVPLALQLIRLHIRCGRFGEAIALLNQINTDYHNWQKQMHQLRGDIAIQQWQFEQATYHYQKAITHGPATHQERTQLARSLILQGEIDAAYEQLIQATKELDRLSAVGAITLPINSHVAAIVNEFRMNPPMMAALQTAQKADDCDRLLAIASLLLQEPFFLGTSLFLARELTMQGVFNDVKQTLPQTTPQLSIPKTIVQFWDEPEPPATIQSLGKTWSLHNPDYAYKRFSLTEAIAFLQTYYDRPVWDAFQRCTHPASQADFFRLAYLSQMGGFYADADDRCQNSLEPLRCLNPELIVYQEDFACFGNNFLGCVPGQPMIRAAFYQALENLLDYSAEWAWSQTGPGLLTISICRGLLPYIGSQNYSMWPRLLVLSRGDLSSFVWSHLPLPYKKTRRSWQTVAYPKTAS